MNHPQSQSSASFDVLFFDSPETFIHPTAIVGPNVTLDHGAKVGPYAVLTGTVMVGARTQIHAHAMIGSSAQDVTVRTPLGRVEIGSDTVIKEFATISAPKSPEGKTVVGDNNYLMHFAHVGHDCQLAEQVVLTNNVLLAGHVVVEKHAVIMAHAAVHQHCRIGAYSALAPYSGARQDIPPFGLFSQQPAHFAGLNLHNLKRNGFSRDQTSALKQLYRWFFHDKVALANLAAHCQDANIERMPAVQTALAFIKNSTRGVSRRTMKERA